jgi:hypothetical protein
VRQGPSKAELKLLKDLQDFLVSCNLPSNVVPTTSELARHGRWAPFGFSCLLVSLHFFRLARNNSRMKEHLKYMKLNHFYLLFLNTEHNYYPSL